jgi:uncharacterized protein (TIGR04255 family)
MFNKLPDPDLATLARPPAQLVVFGLSWEEERPLRPSDGISWQRLLAASGFEGAPLQKVQQQTVNISGIQGRAFSMSPSEIREGWQVARSDQSGHAALYADSCTLERITYPGFDAFADEIRAVAGAAQELLNPSIRTRISLRYANALSTPEATSPSYWREKVSPSFLSLGSDDRLVDDFSRLLSIADFKEGDTGVQVRFAFQPDAVFPNAVVYIFDIEATNGALTSFTIESCVEAARALNKLARKLFNAILTPTYIETLKTPNA